MPVQKTLSTVTVSLFVVVGTVAQEVHIINIRVGQGDATLILGPADAAGIGSKY